MNDGKYLTDILSLKFFDENYYVKVRQYFYINNIENQTING